MRLRSGLQDALRGTQWETEGKPRLRSGVTGRSLTADLTHQPLSERAASAVRRGGHLAPRPSRQPPFSAGPGPAPHLPVEALIYLGVLGPCPAPTPWQQLHWADPLTPPECSARGWWWAQGLTTHRRGLGAPNPRSRALLCAEWAPSSHRDCSPKRETPKVGLQGQHLRPRLSQEHPGGPEPGLGQEPPLVGALPCVSRTGDSRLGVWGSFQRL